MPAPNIASLYDLETAYEGVLANYFANANLAGTTFGQVVTPQTNLSDAAWLTTPRLQIRVGVSGVGQAGSGIQQGQYVFNNVTQNYWSEYQLTAEFTVCTSRNNAAQPHGLLRGTVRQGMLQATAILNNSVLPYYQTVDVLPLTSTQGIEPTNDEINTQMVYQLDVFIPPASFPNS